MTNAFTVLGVAASFNMLSFVYFEAGELCYWGRHTKRTGTLDKAFAVADRWLAQYEPGLLIAPNYEGTTKGKYSRALIETVAGAAANRKITCVRTEREWLYGNKYEEASALGRLYPQIASLVPTPRKLGQNEPPGMVLFEALVITHTWLWRNSITSNELKIPDS